MYHFLAKIGRLPVAKYILPTIASTAPFGYLIFHFHGHDIYKDLFTAFQENGTREKPVQKLINLVSSIEQDILKDPNFFKQPLKTGTSIDPSVDPKLRFFMSSFLDPHHLGMTYEKNGAIFGLPLNFNYDCEDDIPSKYPIVNTFELFTSKEKAKTEEEKLVDEINNITKGGSAAANIKIKFLDLKDGEGLEYAKSLLLSDNAKKFAIAHEIYRSDSHEKLFRTVNYMFSPMMALMLARASVEHNNMRKVHISARLGIYGLAGIVGYVIFHFNCDSLERYYETSALKRTLALGKEYCQGAIEYYTKIANRNIISAKLVDSLRNEFNEDGYKTITLFGLLDMTYKDRIKKAQELLDSYSAESES